MTPEKNFKKESETKQSRNYFSFDCRKGLVTV